MPKIREDFQTENLWSVEDVKSNFNCTDEMCTIVAMLSVPSVFVRPKDL